MFDEAEKSDNQMDHQHRPVETGDIFEIDERETKRGGYSPLREVPDSPLRKQKVVDLVK